MGSGHDRWPLTVRVGLVRSGRGPEALQQMASMARGPRGSWRLKQGAGAHATNCLFGQRSNETSTLRRDVSQGPTASYVCAPSPQSRLSLLPTCAGGEAGITSIELHGYGYPRTNRRCRFNSRASEGEKKKVGPEAKSAWDYSVADPTIRGQACRLIRAAHVHGASSPPPGSAAKGRVGRLVVRKRAPGSQGASWGERLLATRWRTRSLRPL